MKALLLILVLSGITSHATTWKAKNEAIYDVKAAKWITLDDLTSTVQAGDIFVFGEEHAIAQTAADPETYIHHNNQLRLIQGLQKYLPVSVGMEFLSYTDQPTVDAFVYGQLTEAEFLKSGVWLNGNPFQFYGPQILATRGSAGHTMALNIPVSVASDVAKFGHDGLSAADQALLPPIWELGPTAYYARFAEAVKAHANPVQVQNFFWAQCLWDDTMTWKALQSDESMAEVIIVGEFHVQFGGGLPNALKKQTSRRVFSLVQMNVDDWSPATQAAAVTPDATYGPVADFIWVHTGAKSQ